MPVLLFKPKTSERLDLLMSWTKYIVCLIQNTLSSWVGEGDCHDQRNCQSGINLLFTCFRWVSCCLNDVSRETETRVCNMSWKRVLSLSVESSDFQHNMNTNVRQEEEYHQWQDTLLKLGKWSWSTWMPLLLENRIWEESASVWATHFTDASFTWFSGCILHRLLIPLESLATLFRSMFSRVISIMIKFVSKGCPSPSGTIFSTYMRPVE